MKVLPSSVRPDTAEKETFLGPESPEPVEKRLLKEIVMNSDLQTENKVVKNDTATLNGHKSPSESDCENAINGHEEAEVVPTKCSEDIQPRDDECVVQLNGNTESESEKDEVQDNAKEDEIAKIDNEEPAALVNGSAEDKECTSENEQTSVEEKKTADKSEKNIEVAPEENESKLNGKEAQAVDKGYTSSNDDEEIRLVLDDALEEVEREEKEKHESETENEDNDKNGDNNEMETSTEEIQEITDDTPQPLDAAPESEEKADASDVNKPETPVEEISTDNTEATLKEDGKMDNTEDDLKEDSKMDNTEDILEEDSNSSIEKTTSSSEKTEILSEKVQDSVAADSTSEIATENVDFKDSSNDSLQMEVDCKENLTVQIDTDCKEKLQDFPRKRSLPVLESEEVDSKKFKAETDSPVKKEEVVDKMEKLQGAFKCMTRQELEKFLVDAFITNMTRKSQMAIQEQEIIRMKNKCESYKKRLGAVTKLCTDLKSTVDQIKDTNNSAAKVLKPKAIVRHVAVQVPSKSMTGAPQPEKRVRTLAPVNKPQNKMNASVSTPPGTMRSASLIRSPANRQVIMTKSPQTVMVNTTSSSLIATLKSPPKVSSPQMRSVGQTTLKTGDVQFVQSGGRIIIPTSSGVQGMAPNKPVAYLISNSQNRPLLMQSGLGGVLVNKPQITNPGNMHQAARPNILNNRPMQTSIVTNAVQSRQTYTTPGRKLPVQSYKAAHPAPLPTIGQQLLRSGWKALPPKPTLKIQAAAKGIMLSWHLPSYGPDNEEIKSYQIYAYQETTEEPNSKLWKTVGDVKALALPMACTLTQFKEGYKYHFAVRAVDIHNRMGPNSDTMSIMLQKSHD